MRQGLVGQSDRNQDVAFDPVSPVQQQNYEAFDLWGEERVRGHVLAPVLGGESGLITTLKGFGQRAFPE